MSFFNARSNKMDESLTTVENYINKVEGLSRILEKETEYFNARKIKQAEALLETKNAMIADLETMKADIAKSATYLKNLPQEIKEKIIKANQKMMEIAQANFAAASREKAVNEVILGAISEAVSQYKTQVNGYSKAGTMYGAGSSVSPVAMSQTV